MRRGEKNIEDYPLVRVHWIDITNTAEWAEHEQVALWQGFEFEHRCVSVGFLITDAETHIILAAQATLDAGALAMASRIPKGTIKGIWNLRTGDSYAR